LGGLSVRSWLSILERSELAIRRLLIRRLANTSDECLRRIAAHETSGGILNVVCIN
jgi:hypothetical protein